MAPSIVDGPLLWKACSIGLRSGESGGRNQSRAPAALISCRIAAGQPIGPQCTEECQPAPVTVRCKRPQALAFRPPAPEWRHVCLDRGPIDEDQPLRIEMMLQALPPLSSAGNIGTRLLKSKQRFF